MRLNQLAKHRIRFDDDKDECMSHTQSHSTDHSSDFHRIQLANHHPWYNQISEGARHNEDKDARNWEPSVDWLNSLTDPLILLPHINSHAQHRQTASNAGNERQRSSAASSQGNTCNDCKEESKCA